MLTLKEREKIKERYTKEEERLENYCLRFIEMNDLQELLDHLELKKKLFL